MCTVGVARATTVDGFDVGDEVAEAIDRDDHPRHPAIGARAWSPASLLADRRVDFVAEIGRVAAPRRDRRGQRREHIAAMEGGAHIAHAELHQARVVDRITRSILPRAASGANNPLSGASNACSPASATSSARGVPTPGSTTATCTVPAGK